MLLAALAAGLMVLLARPLRVSGEDDSAGAALPAAATNALEKMRNATGCPVASGDLTGRKRDYFGRPALEIRGGESTAGPAPASRDEAVFDFTDARIVSYVCLAHASTRRSGEAIVSLSEASSRGDRLVRAILPGAKLELESIRRHRAPEGESVYYEARYAPAPGAVPLLEPPVRVLLNASTGTFFRLEIDPDWLDAAAPPRLTISRKAAERIVSLVVGRRIRDEGFGDGAVLGKIAAAELFTVRPNDWMGFFAESESARARAAWVVPFTVAGGNAPGLHRLFVDAGTGRILGGLAGRTADPAKP